ncbi:hypothetical protein DVH05_004578 [Phytophthora capsici]|nr:hypothetical protein DVH05_004578 [Phytophthora capsici]
MSTLPDSKVEGITGFSSNPEKSYRYEISLKRGQVNIWVEDRSSKKQWQTGFLAKENYVTSANVFVDAAASDYVSCFEQCLNTPIGEDVGRKLTPRSGGKLKLELSLKIRLLRSARSINYVFELKPIEVEPIDILASKLKDQEEKLERLSEKIGSGTTAFLYIESERVINAKLQWKETIAETFALNEDKTSIKILVPGNYAFGLVVNHTPIANGSRGEILLQMNDMKIQSAATGSSYHNCGNYGGANYASHQTSSSLMCIALVKKDDNLSVVCTNTGVVSNMPSYLTIARIGG